MAAIPQSRVSRGCACACHHSRPAIFSWNKATRGPSLPPRPASQTRSRLSLQAAADGISDSGNGPSTAQNEFCIIESQEAVKDFARLEVSEIADSIMSRQNKIFLLMEEVRRLRIQQRVKGSQVSVKEELSKQKFVSALPFLPPLSEKTLKLYYSIYAGIVASVILFGGLVAPILQLKLGLGGTSYNDFVASMGLPSQLAQVDPIVASFCGGSVGVLSTLLVIELGNVQQQERSRCHYCDGTGYLTCGACVGSGQVDGVFCACCAGTGKVMCTGCLCTGKQMATEHDPRIDPFSAV